MKFRNVDLHGDVLEIGNYRKDWEEIRFEDHEEVVSTGVVMIWVG